MPSSCPTTAGISREWRMIAVCEVIPPTSVRSPAPWPLLSMAVSAGDRSWATIMLSPVRWKPLVFLPVRFLMRRSPTNDASATLLRR